MGDLSHEDTIGFLLSVTGGNEPVQISIRLQLAKHHDELLALVRRSIDWVAIQMMQTPQFYFERTEDELSDVVIKMLIPLGFNATHDTQFGGHCDIVISGRDNFLWIAEAKIHSGYDWLFKGYLQLTTRYSTGIASQSNGEMIVFIRQPRIDLVMKKWLGELRQRVPEISILESKSSSPVFISEQPHQRTGIAFSVRHVPISVFFQPAA